LSSEETKKLIGKDDGKNSEYLNSTNYDKCNYISDEFNNIDNVDSKIMIYKKEKENEVCNNSNSNSNIFEETNITNNFNSTKIGIIDNENYENISIKSEEYYIGFNSNQEKNK
jgi:hypothetical protein